MILSLLPPSVPTFLAFQPYFVWTIIFSNVPRVISVETSLPRARTRDECSLNREDGAHVALCDVSRLQPSALTLRSPSKS